MKHRFASLALIALCVPFLASAEQPVDDQAWIAQAAAQVQAIGNRVEFELGSDSNGPGSNVPVARQKLQTLRMAQGLGGLKMQVQHGLNNRAFPWPWLLPVSASPRFFVAAR